MSPRLTRRGTIVIALALGACSGSAESEGTDDTTQDLLRSVLTSSPTTTNAGGTSTELPALEPPPELVVEDQGRIDIALLGFNIGSDEAPIKVLEMSDYGCAFCRRFHQETWPVLLQEFVATGKVQWKFIPFVTGMFGNSQLVTEAAECTLQQGAELFSALSDRLWRQQSDWKGSAAPAPIVRGWAEEAGVHLARYDSCLAEDGGLGRVAASTTLSRQLGVRGTPTFYVLGFSPIQGALPTDLFVQMLSAAYELATAEPGGE